MVGVDPDPPREVVGVAPENPVMVVMLVAGRKSFRFPVGFGGSWPAAETVPLPALFQMSC